MSIVRDVFPIFKMKLQSGILLESKIAIQHLFRDTVPLRQFPMLRRIGRGEALRIFGIGMVEADDQLAGEDDRRKILQNIAKTGGCDLGGGAAFFGGLDSSKGGIDLPLDAVAVFIVVRSCDELLQQFASVCERIHGMGSPFIVQLCLFGMPLVFSGQAAILSEERFVEAAYGVISIGRGGLGHRLAGKDIQRGQLQSVVTDIFDEGTACVFMELGAKMPLGISKPICQLCQIQRVSDMCMDIFQHFIHTATSFMFIKPESAQEIYSVIAEFAQNASKHRFEAFCLSVLQFSKLESVLYIFRNVLKLAAEDLAQLV